MQDRIPVDLRAFFEERRRPSMPEPERQELFKSAIKAAVLDSAGYRAAERQFQAEEAAAAIAEHYAVVPDPPEKVAELAKMKADIELARRDYPAYKAQRDAEAKERMKANARK